MSSFESLAPVVGITIHQYNGRLVQEFMPVTFAVKEPSCSPWERNDDDDDALLLMLSLLLLLLIGALPISLIMRRVFALTTNEEKSRKVEANAACVGW
jgi:hypothetical protein